MEGGIEGSMSQRSHAEIRPEAEIRINEYVVVDVEPNGVLSLHAWPEQTKGGTVQVIAEYTKGLKELAHMVATEERFSAIREIVAYSWIVTRHPGAVQRLGFTPADQTEVGQRRELVEHLDKKYQELRRRMKLPEDIQPALAIMSREAFLREHGS